jgi:hypothetical protein
VRTSLVLSLILAAAATASAEPARTVCYAGSQTAKVGTMEQTTHAVLERTYDPDKNEIRQRTWSDKNPTKEVAMTGKVDPKTNTFEFDDPELGAKGTGKLEGKPWHWTAFTMTLTKGDLVITSNSKVSDTKIHQEASMTNKGKAVGQVTGDLTMFDCKQLDAKKAELAKAPAAPPPAPKGPEGKPATK